MSYLSSDSEADANVFWHAGSILALAETASRSNSPEGSTPRRSMAPSPSPSPPTSIGTRPRGAGSSSASSQRPSPPSPVLRIGEWDATGALTHYQGIGLERATWQHDIGLTAGHIIFVESPTQFDQDLLDGGAAVPYRWTPGAEGWVGVADRSGDGSDVRWIRQDPCLVTHVLHAHEEAGPVGSGGGNSGSGNGAVENSHGRGGDRDGTLVLYVVRYEVPERGQNIDLASSVIGAAGIGASLIGGGLGVLERWRIEGQTCEQVQVDDRFVEYPQSDPWCEGRAFRYGYGVELAAGAGTGAADVDQLGLLQIDVTKDEVREWRPGEYRVASEPLFVRAFDGKGDDEGWLLLIVHDATRGASDLYVLDASSFGPGRAPQAVVHLPAELPFRSHGTWVGAERYR